MSHAEHQFERTPTHLTLKADDTAAADGEIRLLVKGQGTIGFMIAEKAPFTVTIASGGWGAPAFRWTADFEGLTLDEHRDGEWRHHTTLAGYGLDPEPSCPYWFSFDAHNRMLRAGKGEMRLGCALAHYALPAKVADEDDPYAWLAEAACVSVSATLRGPVDVWRDPVTVEVPMKVIPHDAMTLDLMAAGEVTVPANLTPTCQALYDNVAGARFQLDSGDFPEFAEAIKESIELGGWCAETLKKKASEFGKPDPDMTYLRITLGQNQGESPGIPFVMEIWPVGHYSPVHNHGHAEAVIKVLHGAIDVHLYPMLSPYHERPFATATFEKGDVAWISARLNQFHKLVNPPARGRTETTEPCITIQCYLYADSNRTHWPYFDYLAKRQVAHFDPNSDMDYVAFKAKMREEWDARHPRRNAGGGGDAMLG